MATKNPSTIRTARHKEMRARAGLQRYEVWADERDKPLIKAYAKKLRKKRGHEED
jgi:hypothetical protein